MNLPYNFNQLSMKDLVEGREMFHLHLMNKRNVKATAIGRYLIRFSDMDGDGNSKPQAEKPPRTFFNSLVTSFSWPCILVFVDPWEDAHSLVSGEGTDIVPKAVYMPDGRIIPICVVEAPQQQAAFTDIDVSRLTFPTNLLGGGFPVQIKSQNAAHIASAGCLVTDGHTYYLLTNKHVAGGTGQEITSLLGRGSVRIGMSNGRALGKVHFSALYPDWKCENIRVNCDAALIELDDVTRWKTDVVGIGTMDALYDLNTQTLNLSLLAEHQLHQGQVLASTTGNVVAYGANSGRMEGEILALFYRYQALGGLEFVSDFLISGRNNQLLNTHQGDSGTVWFLEESAPETDTRLSPGLHPTGAGAIPPPTTLEPILKHRPLALLWGQHQFLDAKDKTHYPFVLASNLTNICRELEVDLVRGWNIDNDYSWGKVGHYTVGSLAVDTVEDEKLKELLNNNLSNISFDKLLINRQLDNAKNPALAANPTQGFCPLADVPDIIWKQAKRSADGKSGVAWGRQGDENPNHYADADAETTAGKTLYDYCPTAADLTVANWISYFDALDQAAGLDTTNPRVTGHRGLICFRVWQIFNYVRAAATAGDAARFLFGCGVLAHYVGDGCQPLHASYMSDGDPADNQTVNYTAKTTSRKRNGDISHQVGDVYAKQINPGKGVHVAYEDHMIDDYIGPILQALSPEIARQQPEPIPLIGSGQDAGFAVLTLMHLTQQEIKPRDLVEAFKAAKEQQQSMSKALYDQFGASTVNVLARGCRYLGAIWEAAWQYPGNNITDLGQIPPQALIALYCDPQELPSLHLDTVGAILY